jgi:hypothetical protein
VLRVCLTAQYGVNMNAVISWIIARVSEPSTWAGTGIIATAIHAVLPGAIGDAALTVIQAVAGLAAVVASEKKAA